MTSLTPCDHHGRTVVFGQDDRRGLILSANLLREGRLETLSEYEYDERRNLIRACDRFGKAVEFAYDGDNRVVRRRNRNGMAYTWDYDRRGRVVRTSGDGGVQEGRMEYKDGYNEVHYPGTGATERYHFDDDGLVYLKVDALGGETWYGYNDWHEPTLVGTPEGKVVGREYDGRGNLVRLTHADGGEETWEYDGDNRTTAPPSTTSTTLRGGSLTADTLTAAGRRGNTTVQGGSARPATRMAKRCSSATRWGASSARYETAMPLSTATTAARGWSARSAGWARTCPTATTTRGCPRA